MTLQPGNNLMVQARSGEIAPDLSLRQNDNLPEGCETRRPRREPCRHQTLGQRLTRGIRARRCPDCLTESLAWLTGESRISREETLLSAHGDILFAIARWWTSPTTAHIGASFADAT